MGIITGITQAWLTRSFKGFEFESKYFDYLDYSNSKNVGLYIHIPFCKKICKFCPYCKYIFDEVKMNLYIDMLLKEIDLACKGHDKQEVTSLYFGGGSPALSIKRLPDILSKINKHFIITEGIGIELHPSDVNVENLNILKSLGFTKISIGIQSFQDKFLAILGRKNNDFDEMFKVLKSFEFETVAMDFIFALPFQEFSDIKKDIEIAFSNGANYIAIYPFIDFGFLNGNIHALSKKEKRTFLKDITDYCCSKGYVRDSIWTFSKNGKSEYSSMTRENYLGFGCSATTVLDRIFKINTFDMNAYISRLENNHLPTSLICNFTLRQRMIYYLFWVMYGMELDTKDFYDFFGVELKNYYGIEFLIARLFGFVSYKNGKYRLTEKGAFYYHHYEKYYTYNYINHMWGKMSKEAFPKGLNIK